MLVEKSARSLVKQIAEPLNLGEQGETHFVLGQRWKDHFTRKAAESGAGMTVQSLRKWIDEPRPMGLPKECGNLIILVFAAQTNRSFFRHGAPFDATLTNLPDEVELRQQQLAAGNRLGYRRGTGKPHLWRGIFASAQRIESCEAGG